MRNMKDSGIEWIGKIPEDWEIMKMRYLGNFSSSGIDKKINPEEPLVKIINYTDVYGNLKMLLNNKDYMTVSAPQDKINKNLVEEGDLIFTPSSETIEDIGVSALINEKLENTSFSYHVLRFQFYKNINKQYKKYLCNNNYVQNYFSSRAVGSIRKTLNRDDFKELNVLIPPLEEQELIADYLDKKVKEIDNIISKTQETIEEYKKYKQSVITEAVTKGLNPNVEMKDSGIEWIGKIPKEWTIGEIKRIIEVKDGTHDTPKYVDKDNNTYPLITSKNIINNMISFDNVNHISQEDYLKINQRSDVEKYDIIMPMIGTVGNPAIVYTDTPFSIKNVALFKTNGDIIVAKFIKYILMSDIVINQFNLLNRGGVQAFVSLNNLQNIKIPLINNNSQYLIVSYLDKKCNKIDNLITKKQELITQLESYKKSLIYEYVTGKKEVAMAYGY